MSGPAVLVFDEDPAGVLKEAASALNGGNCIIYPTDTIYGLLARPEDEAAYHAIFRLKGRSAAAPLALLAHPSCAVVPVLSRALAGQAELGGQFTVGRLTVVFDAPEPPGIPPAVTKLQPGSIGVRCPADDRTRALLAACGGLLWATSVNRSGQPPATTGTEVRQWLSVADPALLPLAVVTAAALPGTPSSVIELTTGGFRRIR